MLSDTFPLQILVYCSIPSFSCCLLNETLFLYTYLWLKYSKYLLICRSDSHAINTCSQVDFVSLSKGIVSQNRQLHTDLLTSDPTEPLSFYFHPSSPNICCLGMKLGNFVIHRVILCDVTLEFYRLYVNMASFSFIQVSYL